MASGGGAAFEELPHDGTCDECEPDEAPGAEEVCRECGFCYCRHHAEAHGQKFPRHHLAEYVHCAVQAWTPGARGDGAAEEAVEARVENEKALESEAGEGSESEEDSEPEEESETEEESEDESEEDSEEEMEDEQESEAEDNQEEGESEAEGETEAESEFDPEIEMEAERVAKRFEFDSWVGKMPQKSKWQPAPVFLPGESQGQRSLAGYSSWGRKISDTTE